MQIISAIYGNDQTPPTQIKATYDTGVTLFIPTDVGNIDYQNVLAWVNAGNTIQPYVAPTLIRTLAAKDFFYYINQLGIRAQWTSALAALPANKQQDYADYFNLQPAFPENNPKVIKMLTLVNQPVAAFYTAAIAANTA